MTWLLVVLQIGLSGVFLVAAVSKALVSHDVASALRMSRIPEPLVLPLCIMVPTVEAVLALALLLSGPSLLPLTMSATGLALVALTAWMVWAITQQPSGFTVRCGCFGTGNAELSASGIARNGVLLVAASGGALLSQRVQSPLPEPSLEGVMDFR